MLREMVASDHLPDYHIEEVEGDRMRFTARGVVLEVGQGPQLPMEALEAARALAPGWDVYALEADWRAYWARSGQPRLRSPQAAFLGFVKARIKAS